MLTWTRTCPVRWCRVRPDGIPCRPVEMAAQTFSNWGIAPGVQVVVYDDAGGGAGSRARLVDAALAGPRGRGSAGRGMGGMEPQ